MRYISALVFFFCFSSTMFASFSLTKEQALKFYHAKDYQKSYQIFFHLKEQQKSYEYYFYLGNLSYYLNRFSEAEHWYQKGLAYAYLPSNYYHNYAKLLLEQNKKVKALKILNKIRNKNLKVLLLCFDLSFELKNYKQSEKFIKLILRKTSGSAGLTQREFEAVYFRYFEICIKQKKYKKALALSRLLEKLLSKNVFFKKNYIDLLIKTAQFKKASDLLEEDLKKDYSKSEKLLLYVKLLKILTEYQKNYKKALILVDKAIEELSELNKLVKIKSFILYCEKNYVEAFKLLEKQSPKTKDEIFYFCELAFKAKQDEYAIKLLEKLYLKLPSSKEVLNKLLTVYFRKKEFEKAKYWIAFYRRRYLKNALLLWDFKISLAEKNGKKAFNLALLLLKSKQFKSSGFYYNLAKLYEKNGDFDSALKYYQKSLKIKPDFTYAHASLGALYMLQENYEQAGNHYLILTQILPDYAFYYFQLAQVYALSKQYFLAKEFIIAALKKGFKLQFIKNEGIFNPVFKKFPEILKDFS